MSSTIRIPSELYEQLRQIKVKLEEQYQSAAPSMQDLVSVALSKFIENWENSSSQEQLLDALLVSRKLAREKMGKR